MNSTDGARFTVAISAAVSAVAGGLVAVAPTGDAVADRLLPAALAGGVTLFAANASAVALAPAALALLVVGGSLLLQALGATALIAVLALLVYNRPTPSIIAIIATIEVQALLRLPWGSPSRGSAVVAAVGIVPILGSAVRHSFASRRRRVRNVVLVAAATLVVASGLCGYLAVRSHALLVAAEHDARRGVDAARAGDGRAAGDAFARAAGDFERAHRLTRSWWTWPVKEVPLLAPQVRTVDRVAALGASTMSLAASSSRRVEPERLRMHAGRLDLATLVSYQPTFDEVAAQTRRVRTELAAIPSTWLVAPLADALAKFESTIARADDAAQTARDALAVTPAIFGGGAERAYFVAFVTPAEARGSGGLIANYGVLTAREGRLHLDKIGSAPDLDNVGSSRKHLDGPDDYVARYAKFDVANTWENTTMSPDFPSVGRAIAQLYPQSGGRPIDGVIRVGPTALAGLLSLTGPVLVPNLPLAVSSHNVRDFLLRGQYSLAISNQARGDLLGDIGRAAFDRLTAGVSAKPSAFAEALGPAIDDGDLALWFRNPVQQRFVHRVEADGAVPPVRGDGFGVTVQNGGASKIDAYLHRTIRYTATVDARTGHLLAHAVVVLRNEAPAGGLSPYVIGNKVGLPLGWSRLYVSLYSPFELRDDATLDNVVVALSRERELDRNVYARFVDIPPGGVRTIRANFEGGVDLRSGYRFDALRQPLVNADELEWTLSITSDGRVVAPGAVNGPPVVVSDGGRMASARWVSDAAFGVQLRVVR